LLYMSTAFNEDFTFGDIEFFWGKCHAYLQRIYTKAYKVDTAEAWKDEYIKGQNDFRQLEEEMPTEETEVAIKAWDAKLWPTYQNMENALRSLQWAPGEDAVWHDENAKQNQFLAEMKSDIVVLRWIVKEILRIVNPQNPEYKQTHRKKFGTIPGVIDSLLQATRNPQTLYTRDNLVILVECWKDFYTWTDGTQWHKEFPEWSFMISQFQIFVHEFEMEEIRAKEKEHIDREQSGDFNDLKAQFQAGRGITDTDRVYTSSRINGILDEIIGIQKELKGMQEKMTTTTSSIEDLQGRVKELERPWYERRPKKKVGSGSGERMVDLLEDLEKLSCSEKLEED
jgi:hypothetical protein